MEILTLLDPHRLQNNNMLSPGVISLGSLGSGGVGGMQAFSPNTLAAFGNISGSGLTPSTARDSKGSGSFLNQPSSMPPVAE